MWNNQKQQKLFSLMSNLQTYYHFKLDFPKVDQHTRGKWLIHGTKRRKDNQWYTSGTNKLDHLNILTHMIDMFISNDKLTTRPYIYVPFNTSDLAEMTYFADFILKTESLQPFSKSHLSSSLRFQLTISLQKGIKSLHELIMIHFTDAYICFWLSVY